MNFTKEQREKAWEIISEYYRMKDNLYDEMHQQIERELNLDPEAVGRLLEEEK